MSTSKKNTFLGGAAVLMFGVVIVKLIGALYKVPLLDSLGTVGYGHFMNAYTIFNLLLTIATAGLPVALSKSISEAHELGRQNQVQKTFRVAQLAFLVLGGGGALILFFGAGPLAAWQGDSGAKLAIQALAPCMLFVCGMSTFRGYAQGHGDMAPTSVSQVVEALCKVVVGLFLAGYVMKLAFDTPELRVEAGAAGAIMGVTVGALVGLIYLVILYLRKRRGEDTHATDRPDSTGSILTTLIKVAIPITLGSSVISIVSLLDTNLVQNRLQDALGMTENMAVGLYGTYQSAITLYNLPSAFMIPFTAAAIPAISAALARRDPLSSGRIAESAMRIAALIAFPAGIGLTVLAQPILSLVYQKSDLDVSVAAPLLAVLGIASIFVCIMLICNSILQANGFVNLPIVTAIVGGAVKLVVNYVLVGTPGIGIQGAPVGTLCCFGTVAILDIIVILRVVPSPPNFLRAFVKPLIASLVMGGAAWAVCGLLIGVAGVKLAVLAGIAVGGCIYLVLVVVLRVFSREDLELMPKGDKIAKFLRL